MFCVGAGRRVIMSRLLLSSLFHHLRIHPRCRALRPAHLFPGAAPSSRDPHGVERLCFYLRRRSILGHRHKGVISDVLHAVMGERKKEVTATFRPVFHKTATKTMSSHYPGVRGTSKANGIVNELHRYVSRVLSRFLVYALF